MRLLPVAALFVLLVGCDSGAPVAPLGVSSPVTAVDTPPPAYPERLACNGVGGTVQLRVHIETDGHIRQSEVQQSSGNAELDTAAQQAVLKWTFRPEMQAGHAVAKWIAVPMTFHVPQPRPEHCFVLDEQAQGALKAK
ncbi:energy transducer TonB [Cognatilysobacter lacus]|uniref:Energy transducer TonB n=1 Tax=Cognatilysobacter lacus TaxID=1643323 RepID=A0A5D8YR38_9GAMM|nr:energy transducer TonB [Lysobacter lacus]TZF84432.1 energy transducer TonB [Lysobacter lacus]